ncbi:MAG: MAPEG family protein [Ahniella sp.]|nr:MAPEG family protein [Ahniella sp.]
MQAHIPLITLLTVVLLIAAMITVGRCRALFKISAPATSGHPTFERAFRAQANTNEQVIMFLPLLWVAHFYGYTDWAAWLGYVWLVGRVMFLIGYVQAANRRGLGFLVGVLANAGLLVLGLMGAFKALV